MYGQETFDVIQTFQGDRGLVQNGIAGRLTILELDRLLSLKTAAPPYIPPPAPVLPRTDHYELGTGDPVVVPDKGAGVWKAKPISAAYLALRAAIFDVLPSANVIIGDDAVKHMAHYLGNSGERYTIDLEGMIREVPSAREALEDEAAQAQEFVELLPPGRHSIHSRTSEDGYNNKSENWNWYFATGGYQSWREGEATVTDSPQGRTPPSWKAAGLATMKWKLASVAIVTMLAAGCEGERSTTLDLDSLSRELQVSLPKGTRVLGVDRERGGIDGMVCAKLEVSREDFDQMLSSLPFTTDKFRNGAGRLGADSGFWNPHATPGIRYAQTRTAEGRALHLGYAEAGQGRVVLFVKNHGT